MCFLKFNYNLTLREKMDPVKRSVSATKSGHLAKFAKSMGVCAAPIRNYAICVSSKGAAINKHDCQKQFSQVMACVAQNQR